MRINLDYLRGGKEIFCFVGLMVRNVGSTPKPESAGNILIISTCLIGEFVASMPALGDFIQRNKDKQIDLLVAPSQKSLAERMIGVHTVYTAKPAHGRAIENVAQTSIPFAVYEKTIALRVSPEAYRALRGVSLGRITISIGTAVLYGTHLLLCALRRRTPTQWRQMNFEFFGAKPRVMPWPEIVAFSEADQTKLKEKEFDFLHTSVTKVLIHTNAHWPGKCWEAQKWVALLKKLHDHTTTDAKIDAKKCEFIFIGTKDDEANHGLISSQLGFETHSLIGKVNLGELLVVMTKVDYFLGIDSGPANLAHLADLRSVTIFGMGPHMYLPWNPKDKVLDKSGGRGMLQMFFETKKSFISQISVDEVYTEFMKLVQENSAQ